MIEWDLQNQKPNRHFYGHMSNVTCMSYDPMSNNYVSTGSWDTKVKIWDCREKEAIATYKNHRSPICALKMSPNLRYLASGSEDGNLKIWDITMGKCISEFNNPNGQPSSKINCIKFHPIYQ